MATSGDDTFSVSRDDIINAAYEGIGMKGIGRVLSAEDIEKAALRLNLIVKQWMGTADFAPGLKMWSRKTGYLFLQDGTYEYTLGPSGSHATSSYVSTTLSAALAIAATAATVASITGISSGDNIGLEMSNGSLHWTTVNGAPSGSTVTLTTGPTVACDSGAKVYAYTSKVRRPLEILTMVRRNNDGIDDPMYQMLRETYELIADKDATGTPTQYLYESTLTNGTLYLDTAPDDVTDVLRFIFLRPIEDFDASTDTPDFPQQWYRPLVNQLGMDLGPGFGKDISAVKLLRDESLSIAQNWDAETTNVFFQSET